MYFILPFSNVQLVPRNPAVFNIVKDFLNSVLIERWDTNKEFKKDYTNASPVNLFCYFLTMKNFWSDIVRSADNVN